MACFRCFIRGENFASVIDGQRGMFGFFVTRFVEAADASEAESLAVAALRADPRLAPPSWHKPTGTPAVVVFDKIEEIAETERPAQQPGFVWFPMTESG